MLVEQIVFVEIVAHAIILLLLVLLLSATHHGRKGISVIVVNAVATVVTQSHAPTIRVGSLAVVIHAAVHTRRKKGVLIVVIVVAVMLLLEVVVR